LSQHGSTEATEPCDDGYEPLAVAFQQEQCEEATHGDTINTSCHSHRPRKPQPQLPIGSGKVMELLKVLQQDGPVGPVGDLGKWGCAFGKQGYRGLKV